MLSPITLLIATFLEVVLLSLTLVAAKRNWPGWAVSVFAVPALIGALWLVSATCALAFPEGFPRIG